MSAPDPAAIAAAVSELANTLQVAVPVAGRIRQRAEALAEDADRLETAIERAAQAVRRLQPRTGGTDGTP
jgi:predicted ATP-grasp superfamily ATP-dependent carboligase